MQDVIGGQTDPARFAAFLDDWQAILARRVAEAVAAITAVEGVRGLVLAGGIGRGAPWPLSDIDLLPVYATGQTDEAARAIEQLRPALLACWIDEGWCTGLDIGRLAFTTDEVDRALIASDDDLPALLTDDRWYHSLDKGYGGRAVHDIDGRAESLATWLTRQRYNPVVVDLRRSRARAEIERARQSLSAAIDAGEPIQAVRAIQDTVKWLRALLLEAWGERDCSQARVGARFDRLAAERGLASLANTANALCGLDDSAVARRLALAPDWVHERHDRSWRARRLTGEPASQLEDARDVLRVCSLYALRAVDATPAPGWLAIPANTDDLSRRVVILDDVIAASTPAMDARP